MFDYVGVSSLVISFAFVFYKFYHFVANLNVGLLIIVSFIVYGLALNWGHLLMKFEAFRLV